MNLMKIPGLIGFSLLWLCACETEKASLVQSEEIIQQLKEAYAPDSRVAVFAIEPGLSEGNLVLRGESNLGEAVDSLRLMLRGEGISFIDSIRMLPEKELEGAVYGIVKLSVANLRSAPKHAAELVTQATMGTPLKVLKKRKGWYLVQSPDHYIAWVDAGGLVTRQKEEFAKWKAGEKLIFLKPFGFAYEQDNKNASTVSDLVAGNVLELTGESKDYYQVKYPHGAVAYVLKEEAKPYQEWVASLNPSGSSLVRTSVALKGLPYLWGGTSFKGVDCSGFTKTVYFLNGMIIPRDASQQIHTGEFIDSLRSFEQLLPGDLLFFGKPATASAPERIIHVGMWIGNNEFIHASGEVRISSMDSSAANFDQYNYDRYLRTKRLLQHKDDKIVPLNNSSIF